MDQSGMANPENKQRAKFYQLTAAGKKQLTRERSKWSQLSDAIAGVAAAGGVVGKQINEVRSNRNFRCKETVEVAGEFLAA